MREDEKIAPAEAWQHPKSVFADSMPFSISDPSGANSTRLCRGVLRPSHFLRFVVPSALQSVPLALSISRVELMLMTSLPDLVDTD